MRFPRRRPSSAVQLLIPILAFALTLTLGSSADAVIGGQPDGTQHPNVGLIFGLNSQGFSIYWCTGTLIDPVTVLTAAHCVGGHDFGVPVAQIVIDFDQSLQQLPDGTYLIARYVTGVGDPNPLYQDMITPTPGTGGSAGFMANTAYDVGLLHLTARADTVFPGIQPMPITASDTNEIYRTGAGKALVLQVGYGVQRLGPPGQPGSLYVDFTRNQSSLVPKKVTDSLLFLGGNPNNAIGYGSPCAGDSGSPVLRDGTIISLFVASQGACQNIGGGPRLDAGPARDFLRMRGLVS
jgi:hypothetical protein